MNVKTRNWGPEFRGVSNLMGLKSVAVRDNEGQLKTEVAAHDGSHAYGRHGAQTGWEAQLVRAVTQITPDQAHDPMGLNPSIRRWNGINATSNVDGSTVFDLFDDHGQEPTIHATGVGNVAGGFLTPEAQFLARARGMAVVASLNGADCYAATYQFKTGPKKVRFPVNSIRVVVDGGAGGYGIGFAQRDPKAYRAQSLDMVRKCIEGFYSQKTGDQLFPGVGIATFKFNKIALRRKQPLFQSIEDLADFFDLDILWQKTCSLIFRRTHVPASNTHGPWRLITMFPDGDQPGWAPSLWLSDPNKVILKANGMNANAKDYHWTGLTASRDLALKRWHQVPVWA